jgi:hypothetical protein
MHPVVCLFMTIPLCEHVAAHASEIQLYKKTALIRPKKVIFFMSSIKMFNFILKTQLTISGRSDDLSPRGRADKI